MNFDVNKGIVSCCDMGTSRTRSKIPQIKINTVNINVYS